MKKSTSSALAIAFFLSVANTSFAAPTTFKDVPPKHWSYDAVAYLAHAGIIDGYNDQSFQGDKTMTRYEMAEIVYKALKNESKANIAQKALIDKLASEYALEMNKIDTMDTRLTKVEQNQSPVKFSGRLLEQWKEKNNAADGGWSRQQWQVRLQADAAVDENTTMSVRLANPAPTAANFRDATANFAGANTDNSFKADRFFATTKVGDAKVTIGRQAMDIDPEDIIVDSGYFSYDGAKVAWDWNGLKFDVKRGIFAKGVTGHTFGNGINTNAADFNNINNDSVMVAGKSGKMHWDAAWAKFTSPTAHKTLMNYYFSNLGYRFDDTFSMSAEAGKNTKATVGGKYWMASAVYGAQSLNAPGKQNFTVTYLHSGMNSVNGIFTSFDQPSEDGDDGTNGSAWNNLDLAYRYAFSKNMTGKLEYGKVMDRNISAETYHLYKLQLIYKI